MEERCWAKLYGKRGKFWPWVVLNGIVNWKASMSPIMSVFQPRIMQCMTLSGGKTKAPQVVFPHVVNVHKWGQTKPSVNKAGNPNVDTHHKHVLSTISSHYNWSTEAGCLFPHWKKHERCLNWTPKPLTCTTEAGCLFPHWKKHERCLNWTPKPLTCTVEPQCQAYSK